MKVAPPSLLDCHWYASVVPVAVTLKVAVAGAVTVWSAGCTVIAGATGAGVTVSRAALLVTLPRLLLTTTRYKVPLWPSAVAPVSKLLFVAPAMAVKATPSALLDHW